jgi:putative protease
VIVSNLLAITTGYDIEKQCLEIDVKNKFSVGDKLELVLPEGNIEFTLETLINKTGDAITVAPGSGYNVKIPYTGPVPKQGLVARYL